MRAATGLRRLLLVAVLVVSVLTPLGVKPAASQLLVCYKSSHGDAVVFGSITSCPVLAYMVTSSTLYKYDPYSGQESFLSAAYSGGFTTFDWANGTNPDGSAGSYYTYGLHSVTIPGVGSANGASFWYFSV